MRDVLNIDLRKIVVPAGTHAPQDTAHFSSLHPKNLLTSRSEFATKSVGASTTSYTGVDPPMQTHVMRVCFCPRFIDGGSPVAVMPGAVQYTVVELPPPEASKAFGWRVLTPSYGG